MAQGGLRSKQTISKTDSLCSQPGFEELGLGFEDLGPWFEPQSTDCLMLRRLGPRSEDLGLGFEDLGPGFRLYE